MKTYTFAVVTSLTIGSALADDVNFDDLKTGAPPPGWTATKTGKGDPKWEVVADDSAPSKPNVLKQSGEATYQAGGVIWRCRDADNYYISRANALEDNVTIYHTVNGKR